jgi:hypothetical protein
MMSADIVAQHSGSISAFVAAVIVPMALCGAALAMFWLGAKNQGRH